MSISFSLRLTLLSFYRHWSLIPSALWLMKESTQNLNDSLNTMNSGKMILIKEKETCQHPSSQLLMFCPNRYRQDVAKDHSKRISQFVASFSPPALFRRVTNMRKLFVLCLSHTALMQARRHFAQFQEESGSRIGSQDAPLPPS